MEISPSFAPSSKSVVNTAKVCSVKGTGPGMDIHEHIAVMTAMSAIITMDKVLLLDFIFDS